LEKRARTTPFRHRASTPVKYKCKSASTRACARSSWKHAGSSSDLHLSMKIPKMVNAPRRHRVAGSTSLGLFAFAVRAQRFTRLDTRHFRPGNEDFKEEILPANFPPDTRTVLQSLHLHSSYLSFLSNRFSITSIGEHESATRSRLSRDGKEFRNRIPSMTLTPGTLAE